VHILGHGKRLYQLEMLVDHADSRCNRLLWRGEGGGVAIHGNFAAIGLLNAGQDVHQGRFPGAILAQQGMNPAGINIKIDVAVGYDAGEHLADPPQGDQRGCAGGKRQSVQKI